MKTLESIDVVPWDWNNSEDSIKIKEKDGFVWFRMSTGWEPPHGSQESKWFVGPKLIETGNILTLDWSGEVAHYSCDISAIVPGESMESTSKMLCELRADVRAKLIRVFTKRIALKRCRSRYGRQKEW